jgi:hypothetical protein
MDIMYYMGLDVHKEDDQLLGQRWQQRQVHQEVKMGATRRDLDSGIKTLPQSRMMAMEATIFTGSIYDHLLPHAHQVKVAHPRFWSRAEILSKHSQSFPDSAGWDGPVSERESSAG